MLTGGIAALASLIVGSIIVSGSSDIVYENALDRLNYEANTRSFKLVADIQNLSEDVNYLAGTPPVQGIPRTIANGGIDPLDSSSLETWNTNLETIFAELIRAKRHYLQIRYIGVSDNGRELVRVEREGNLIRVQSDEYLQQKGDTAYFRNTVKQKPGEVYLSDITLNREFDQISEPQTPVIRAARSIYFEGQLYGVIVINMAFDKIFSSYIKNTPRELTPYVINESGYFLAHPNADMAFGFDLDRDHRIQDLYPELDFNLDTDPRITDFTFESSDAVLHIVKARFDSSRPDRYLAVVLATSHDHLQSGAMALRYEGIKTIGLLVVICSIVAAILASKLMQPLQLISAASDDLANGREVSNLPVTANDEIGELARSFDAMRGQLADKERELIVSQGLVHHANKMSSIGEMAAGMAHEINSPIQAISLIAERVQLQLKQDISAEEIDASMSEVIASVDKVSGIIESMRKVSRDSVNDEFVSTRLSDLIADIANMTTERLNVGNIKFEVSYHGVTENTLIQCQHLQISQVLVNLVNNAYDAIQQLENKWISIDFKKISDRIQISVTDSGEGIPCGIVDRIFEPMFTTKEVGKGTGLGLSISQDISVKHDGFLYVDSESANTRFTLELPMVHS